MRQDTKVYFGLLLLSLIKDGSVLSVAWAFHVLDAAWVWAIGFVGFTDCVAVALGLIVWYDAGFGEVSE